MRLLLYVVVNAAALAVAAWLLDGITVTESGVFLSERDDRWVTLALVGGILGLVNAIVKPVVKLVSLPLILLTLGLALLVINALMLLLTSGIAGALDLGFHVDGFWTALLGSIVITLVTWGVDSVIGDDDR